MVVVVVIETWHFRLCCRTLDSDFLSPKGFCYSFSHCLFSDWAARLLLNLFTLHCVATDVSIQVVFLNSYF